MSIDAPIKRRAAERVLPPQGSASAMSLTGRTVLVVEASEGLMADLTLASVAEGIETIETWACLRDLGCERGQGYLIARPMPGEQLLDWARQDRTFLR